MEGTGTVQRKGHLRERGDYQVEGEEDQVIHLTVFWSRKWDLNQVHCDHTVSILWGATLKTQFLHVNWKEDDKSFDSTNKRPIPDVWQTSKTTTPINARSMIRCGLICLCFVGPVKAVTDVDQKRPRPAQRPLLHPQEKSLPAPTLRRELDL